MDPALLCLMDDFLRPILDTLTLRKQREWKDVRNFHKIEGLSYSFSSSPLAEVMPAAAASIHGRKFRLMTGSSKVKGQCTVEIDRIAIRERGGTCDIRVVFAAKDSREKLVLWFRWEMEGPDHLKATYLIRGSDSNEKPSDLAIALSNGIIDQLDSFIQKRAYLVDSFQSYTARGWSAPAQALDLSFDGSVFLTGGRHGSEFVPLLGKALAKTGTLARTTDSGVTWLVQTNKTNWHRGHLTGVLLCQPEVDRSIKTFYTAISCVITLKPVLSVPNRRPAIKVAFGLIGDLAAAGHRFDLASVLIELVQLVNKCMLSFGATICGELLDSNALVEQALTGGKIPHIGVSPGQGKLPRAAGVRLGASGPPPLTLSTSAAAAGHKPPPLTRLGHEDSEDDEDYSQAYATEKAEQATSLVEEYKRWPSAQDFCEAIQMPAACFVDSQLRGANLDVDGLGLPRVTSGAFACVFKLSADKENWAVRCFTTRIRDQFLRYERIGAALSAKQLQYTLNFDYLERGIRVEDKWYPIVKLPWVEGLGLNEYICLHRKDTGLIEELRQKFRLMLKQLHSHGIAHGDLQHGNIMVRNDELVLIDYDGMFVPSLKGFSSPEKGHPNYQHPQRNSTHFSRNLDNFSGWLIDSALLTLSIEPDFWLFFGAGDESILFRRTDLLAPFESELLQTMAMHPKSELSLRARLIRDFLAANPDDIPPVFLTKDELAVGNWREEIEWQLTDEPGHTSKISSSKGDENVDAPTDDNEPWWAQTVID